MKLHYYYNAVNTWVLNNLYIAHPEYFYAYSGQILQQHCRFATTPGEILWFISNMVLTTNDSFLITQRLLHSTPNVLYEGVLDIVDDSYWSHSLDLQCIIHNTIIGNNLDSTLLIETIGSKYSIIYKLDIYVQCIVYIITLLYLYKHFVLHENIILC